MVSRMAAPGACAIKARRPQRPTAMRVRASAIQQHAGSMRGPDPARCVLCTQLHVCIWSLAALWMLAVADALAALQPSSTWGAPSQASPPLTAVALVLLLLQLINEKPQIIQDYESGKAIPNPQVLSKLSRVLGVTLRKNPGK